MKPRIVQLPETRLVGINMKMSLQDNKTGLLWKQFMPRRNEIQYRVNSDCISMQIYGKNWTFSPQFVFTKWASVEVSSFSSIPPDMHRYTIEGGSYAVFRYKGSAARASEIMHYIFADWLPNSAYQLDDREHFEILPESYNPFDENAEEDIWIPIIIKSPDSST